MEIYITPKTDFKKKNPTDVILDAYDELRDLYPFLFEGLDDKTIKSAFDKKYKNEMGKDDDPYHFSPHSKYGSITSHDAVCQRLCDDIAKSLFMHRVNNQEKLCAFGLLAAISKLKNLGIIDLDIEPDSLLSKSIKQAEQSSDQIIPRSVSVIDMRQQRMSFMGYNNN